MSVDQNCKICGVGADVSRLEKCGICAKFFCNECAHRAYGGRRFCSAPCAHAYFFQGELDDDEDTLVGHEE